MKYKYLNVGGRVPVVFRWHQKTTEINIITYVDLLDLLRNGIKNTLDQEMKRINAPQNCYRHVLMDGETLEIGLKQRIPITYKHAKYVKPSKISSL